jgi:hypothetical protein
MTRASVRKSKILQKDRDDMIALCKRMKPEERLLAFYHHSRLISQIYEAGVRYRKRTAKKQ